MAAWILLRSLRRCREQLCSSSYRCLTANVKTSLLARPFCSTLGENNHIGIDFGSTNTRVAVMEGNKAKVIHTSPSAVAFNENGQLLFGTQAKHWALTDPTNTVFGIKQLLGRKFDDPELKAVPYKMVGAPWGDAWIKVYGRVYAPSQIVGFILTNMKRAAESYLGKSVPNFIISFADGMRLEQAEALMEAGIKTGINRILGINDMTAAAISYGLLNKEGLFAVLGFGGRNFVVSILEVSNGKVHIKASESDTLLGGEDFDNALMEFLVSEFRRTDRIDLTEDQATLQRLREAVENAKIELSSTFETEINLPFITTDASSVKHLNVALSRSNFESLVNHLIGKARTHCANCLKESGVTAMEVDEVLLTGGMARVPKVQEVIAEIFGKSPSLEVNPDEAIALGAAAAIEGGMLRRDVWENDLSYGSVLSKFEGMNTSSSKGLPLIAASW